METTAPKLVFLGVSGPAMVVERSETTTRQAKN